MAVQAFVDESGGKGQGGSFVLAGLVAHADHWARFSIEWQSCLEQKPSIKYFKMREAASLRGQFNLWPADERDNKLRALAKIIDKYVQIAIYCAIDLDAHAETWAVSEEKPLNEPYFFPFHVVIMGICFELWEIGWRERFEIIFDDEVIFGPRAKAWYPAFRDVLRVREPDAHSILPVEPMFREDTEFLPIQAADLFAWNFRRGANKKNGEFNWLLDELSSVQLSEYSTYYHRERMVDVVSESARMIRDGEIPRNLVEKYRKIFGR